MGKAFASELAALSDTLAWAQAQNVSLLERFVADVAARTLIAIGSGGSSTACHLVALLHRTRHRRPAQFMTPLPVPCTLRTAISWRKANPGRPVIEQVAIAFTKCLCALHERSMLLSANDLFGGTIADNLRMGRGWISAADLQGALERVGVGADVRAMPEAGEATILTGGQPLSGRQRAKLVLARALLARPSLLLVDQLLDGLDEQSRADMASILLDPQMPWTVVIATRDPRVAARFPRTVDLDAAKGGSDRG
jgi:hypothetical protein